MNDLKTDIVRSQSVRSELVRKHMGLVIVIAKHHRGRGLSFQDLVQEVSATSAPPHTIPHHPLDTHNTIPPPRPHSRPYPPLTSHRTNRARAP